MMYQISYFLIISGFIIVITGILYLKLQKLKMTRLSVDLLEKKEDLEIYIPLTT